MENVGKEDEDEEENLNVYGYADECAERIVLLTLEY